MIKNLKMSLVITTCIAIISVLCLGILFAVQAKDMTNTMRDTAIETMQTALDAQVCMVEQFSDSAETTLKAYGSAQEITDVLKHPEDAGYTKTAQDYTARYYACLDGWEGIYTADWTTKTLVHSLESAQGLVLRTGDAVAPFLGMMTAEADGLYNQGIFLSPSSGQMLMNMRLQILDSDGKTPIGFVGGGVLATKLGEMLNEFNIVGFDGAEYNVLDSESLNYTLSSDKTLIGQTIEDQEFLTVLENVAAGNDNGYIEYKDEGQKYIMCYRNLPQLHLVLTMRDSEKEVFQESREMTTKLLIYCLGTLLILMLASYFVAKWIAKPLMNVESAVDDLGQLSLTRNDKIQGYIGAKSEVGKMATAVENLTEIWNKIIETLNGCSESLNSGSDTMEKTAVSLVDCAMDNMATTEELSASMSNTNASIEGMNSDVSNITERIRLVNEQLKDGKNKGDVLFVSTKDMAENAKQTLSATEDRIEQTKSNISRALESLQELTKINQMAEQILDITSQTNLLSLNASIEAARAGEAGRGFAVVAGEIGNLANDSSRTVGEIQKICQETNASIDGIKNCFDEIIEFMEKEVSMYFSGIATTSGDCSASVNELKDMIERIEQESNGVMDSVESIKQQMETIYMASNENENAINNIIEKNEVTNEMAEQVNNLVREQQENSRQIKEIIDKFKR